jgi:hypothetical protein
VWGCFVLILQSSIACMFYESVLFSEKWGAICKLLFSIHYGLHKCISLWSFTFVREYCIVLYSGSFVLFCFGFHSSLYTCLYGECKEKDAWACLFQNQHIQ